MKRTPLKKNSNSSLNKGNSQLKKSPLKKNTNSLKKSGKIKVKPKSEEKKLEEKINREAMRAFFLKMWEIKPHYSEVSGKWLGDECKSIYQHHIIPKSVCEDGKFDPDNIVFLTADEHALVENDIYCFELVNERREILREKYNQK